MVISQELVNLLDMPAEAASMHQIAGHGSPAGSTFNDSACFTGSIIAQMF